MSRTPAVQPDQRPAMATVKELQLDVFARYGLSRIINASGMQTDKGASPVCLEALAAVNGLATHSVDMLELQSLASRTLADAFETEAGVIVNCTAAGIAITAAACLAGDDVARAEALPDAVGPKREVILQRGHNVSYSARIAQNVAIAGARVVEIGATNECAAYQLRGAFTAETAAALYVVSHHTVQTRQLSLDTFCAECHRRQVPVIVDAAGQPDPRVFLRQGADLVITSLHKHFESLTAGAIAGRRDLIRACLLQIERGVGRPMKAGKEAIIAGVVALERWAQQDFERKAAFLTRRLQRAKLLFDDVPRLKTRIELDSTSRSFSRLVVELEAVPSLSAKVFARALAAQRPAIYVQLHRANEKCFEIDLRRISDAQLEYLVQAVRTTLRDRRALLRAARPDQFNLNAADEIIRALRTFPLPASKSKKR